MENHTEQVNDMQESIVETAILDENLKRAKEQILLNQNYPFGLISGIIAGIIGAILWAVITVASEYQIGYMAVAIGLLVGYTIRTFGKGVEPIFGITGAIIAFLSCVLGNFLSIVGFVATAEGLGYFETLGILNYAAIPEIMMESFNPIDLLFYGIAVYEGYKFSILKTE